VTKRREITWHEGITVSSEEFPSHKPGSHIVVPPRVKRKHARAVREIMRGAQLKPGEDGYLGPEEADKKLVDILLEIGVRWNWLDAEGGPLPQPEDDPSVYDEISEDEITFILTHVTDGTRIPPRSATG